MLNINNGLVALQELKGSCSKLPSNVSACLDKFAYIWKSGLYFLLYILAYSLAETITYTIVLVQFVILLLTSKPNERLQAFGKSLSEYIHQVLLFLTFNTEERPYPFGEWPSD